jgi:hypothetical protein
MSGMAREAGAARRGLNQVSVAGRVDRLSLIGLGRRHLVRARHTQHGCSVVELYIEPAGSGLWLVALAAGRRPAALPFNHAATVQVMQGRIRASRDSLSQAVLPGDLVLGPVLVEEMVAVSDAVVVLTGTPFVPRPVLA